MNISWTVEQTSCETTTQIMRLFKNNLCEGLVTMATLKQKLIFHDFP
jgi:hypothetical protein